MIKSRILCDALAECGIDSVLSVPCSSLAGLLSGLASDVRFRHIAATSEAEAVCIAAGMDLAGRRPIVLMQNSGFCESLNVIGSLLHPYRLGIPLIVSGRGAFGTADEPQHALIGSRMKAIAQVFGLPFQVLDSHSPLKPQLERLLAAAKCGHGAVMAVPVGTLADDAPGPEDGLARAFSMSPKVERRMQSEMAEGKAAIRALRAASPHSVFVATTGFTGRELFASGDCPENFYVVGSMGGASAIGLGLALSGCPGTVVLDGDGAMLMRMGNCATIAASKPGNYAHVVLNNGVYASTGGQPTLGRSADLAAVAQACGYATVVQTTDHEHAAGLVARTVAGRMPSPLFVDLWVVDAGVKPCERPDIAPVEQARRLRALFSRPTSPRATEAAFGDLS